MRTTPHIETGARRAGTPVSAGDLRPAVRLLLVEDHEDTAHVMSALLRHHGFHGSVAGSIEAALKVSEGSYDVLISDIRLPDGSGMDLMRRLRESRGIHGIAMSGFGSQDDIRRSLEAGYDEHLVKPVDLAQLIEAIHRIAGQVH
jgi:DNA-binding response OmpR family regulator